MYNWRVEIMLEGGFTRVGKYAGPETNSDAVANKLFTGNPNAFNGIEGATDRHILFFKCGAVVAFDISPW